MIKIKRIFAGKNKKHKFDKKYYNNAFIDIKYKQLYFAREYIPSL